jgi:hypothetical protein
MATTPPTPLTGPAVANGTVVATAFGSPLLAFDANGVSGCSGTPTVCAPLWRSGPDDGVTDLTVAGGRVYQGSRSSAAGLLVYDLAGRQGCSGTPIVCAPLWTGVTSDPSEPVGPPSVANGVAYLVSGDDLWAFDASGTTGCGGTPTVCAPLWSAAIPGGARRGPAVVANGRVFVGSDGLPQTFGFDAAGVTRCSGTPKICLPTWKATHTVGAPSVANGKVFLRNQGALTVYDATAEDGCSGRTSNRSCRPLWTYSPHAFQCHLPGPCDSFSAYSVAGDVVYEGFSGVATGDVTAYDATGTIDCSGTPKVCGPLQSWPAGVAAAPVVANGSVYASWAAGPGFATSGFQALRTLGAATITVTPHTGLADGQSVTVAGTGFPPGFQVLLTECSSSILQQGINGIITQCTDGHGNFPPGTQNVSPDASGAFRTSYVVTSGGGACATVAGTCALIGATVPPPKAAFAGVALTFTS